MASIERSQDLCGYSSEIFIELSQLESLGVPVRCAICTEVLRSAVETSCHHLFCKGCIRRSIRTSKQCPVCRRKVDKTELRPAGSIDRMILQQKVRCTNSSSSVSSVGDAGAAGGAGGSGCEWTGALSDVPKHCTTCKFQPVSCAACGASFLRSQTDQHNTQCPMRVVCCDECKESMRFRELESHKANTCEYQPVKCPNGCGLGAPSPSSTAAGLSEAGASNSASGGGGGGGSSSLTVLLRKDVDLHISKHCPLQAVACTFRAVGCTARVPRKELAAHLDSHASQHLAATVTELGHAKEAILALQKEMKELRVLSQQQALQITVLQTKEEKLQRALGTARALPSTTTHTIVLNNFAQKCQEYPTGSFWESAPFESPGGGLWALRVYPNGWTEQEKDDVGVFLSATNNTEPVVRVSTSYTITLVNPYASVTFEKIFNDEYWGAPSFVPKSDLTSDKLVFKVELKILGRAEDDYKSEE